MKKNRYVISIFAVTLGNVASLLSGVVAGFLIPKLLTVEEYGYFKTFSLYATYLGMCHLGIIDGIVLRFGDYDYVALPRKELRRYWRWYVWVNAAFALLLVLVSCWFTNSNLRFIGFALALNLLVANGITFFQQISEITQRFGELSLMKVVYSLSSICCILFLAMAAWLNYPVDFRGYLLMTVANGMLFLTWYMVTYREIIWGAAENLRVNLPKFQGILREGFPLMISSMCSTLLLTLDRQFVNLLFDAVVYAKYAFAYNLLSLITVATSAVSSVLYPYLKRTSGEERVFYFPVLVYIGLDMVLAGGLVFFPLSWLIGRFLPKYQEALIFFRIIYPALALNSVITVVFQNYYKSRSLHREYFRISAVILGVALAANVCAYGLFHTPEAISWASVAVAVLWYWNIGSHLRKIYPFPLFVTLAFWFCGAIVFYWATGFERTVLGGGAYILCLMIMSLVVKYRNRCYN